jgi:poly-beta-hydroxyalkanoate depolymerase
MKKMQAVNCEEEEDKVLDELTQLYATLNGDDGNSYEDHDDYYDEYWETDDYSGQWDAEDVRQYNMEKAAEQGLTYDEYRQQQSDKIFNCSKKRIN